jgi:hypothetical protein
MSASHGWSGGYRESCCGEPPGEFALDHAQDVTERVRRPGLVAGHQRAQDAVTTLV